jgi:hypothetical protein
MSKVPTTPLTSTAIQTLPTVEPSLFTATPVIVSTENPTTAAGALLTGAGKFFGEPLYFGLVVASTFLLLFLLFICIFCLRRRKKLAAELHRLPAQQFPPAGLELIPKIAPSQ